jgi:hypothetical protein
VFVFDVCHSGSAGGAERALAPLRAPGKPLADTVGPVDYVKLQRSGDDTDPRNEGSHLESGFIDDFPAPLVAAIIDGYYTNEVANEPQKQVDENYQGRIGRLVELKNRHDPTNLFRLDANVKPTV